MKKLLILSVLLCLLISPVVFAKIHDFNKIKKINPLEKKIINNKIILDNFNEPKKTQIAEDVNLKLTFIPEIIDCDNSGMCRFSILFEKLKDPKQCYNLSTIYFQTVPGDKIFIPEFTNLEEYSSIKDIIGKDGLTHTIKTPTPEYQQYLNTGELCFSINPKKQILNGYFRADGSYGKFDAHFPFDDSHYIIDPYWQISNNSFVNGTYNKTRLTDDGSAIIAEIDKTPKAGYLDTTDLLFHMQLDEPAGTTLFNNATGGLGDFTLAGSYSLDNQGISDRAVKFTGSGGGRAYNTDAISIPAGGNFTLMYWDKIEQPLTTYMTTLGFGGSVFAPYVSNVGDVGFYKGSLVSMTAINHYVFGEWNHFAFIQRDGNITFYLNGEATFTKNENVAINSAVHYLARSYSGTSYDQTLDEYYFFNRSLSTSELDQYLNYNRDASYTSEILDAGEIVSWNNITFNITKSGLMTNSSDTSFSKYNVDLSDAELLLYFDGPTNNTALIDYSGKNRTVIASGGGTYNQTGRNNQAVELNNLEHYTIDMSDVNASQGYTLSGFWNYLVAPPSRYAFAAWGTAANGFEFRMHPSKYLQLYIQNGTTTVSIDTNGALQIPMIDWVMVTLVVDPANDQIRFYSDGKNYKNATFTGIPVNGGNLYINSRGGTSYQFDGKADDFIFLSKPLSDLEVKNLYRSQRGNWNSLQARSCADISCSGEGWIDLTITGQTQPLNISNNQYFQYKVNWDNRFWDWGAQLQSLEVDYITVPSAPMVAILNPTVFESVRSTLNITWNTTDLNSDKYLTEIKLNETIIVTNISDDLINFSFDTTSYANKQYELTVESCENETIEKLCGNDTISFTIDNDWPKIIINQPIESQQVYNSGFPIEWTITTDYDYYTNVTISNASEIITSYLNLSGSINSIAINWDLYDPDNYSINITVKETTGPYLSVNSKSNNFVVIETTTYTLKDDMLAIINYSAIATFIICASLLLWLFVTDKQVNYSEYIRVFATAAVGFSVIMFIGANIIPILIS